MSACRREIIDLDRPAAWPADLRRTLMTHHDALRSREIGPLSDRFDAAIYEVVDALQPYNLVGWHCTRLADHEVTDIIANGMSLLDVNLVSRRVDAAMETGILGANHGARLKAKNQAAEQNRAGKLWFCFFRPAIAGESGIGDLVRFWGGEAIYNSHDRDDEIGPIIAAIGSPAIVEAEVPIAWLGDRGLGLALNVGRRFVVAEGTPSREPLHIECYIKQPLPAELITNVHLHPSAEFKHLTDCGDWHRPL
jgi:hypothetical protein